MYIVKGTEKVLGLGHMAAHIENMAGKTNDRLYDHVVSRLAAMKNIGQLEGFTVAGQQVTVIKIG